MEVGAPVKDPTIRAELEALIASPRPSVTGYESGP